MNAFFGNLAETCRAYPSREKILVVPSLLAGHQALESLALEGVAWANLKPATPLDLAWAVAAPRFARGGVSRISRGRALHLVEEAVQGLRVSGGLQYFGRLKSPLGPAPMLLDTIRELRMAGVAASGLEHAGFVDPQKGAELRVLLRSYEDALAAGGLADDASIYSAAIETIRENRVDPDLSAVDTAGAKPGGPVYLVPQWLEFEPLAYDFLNELAAGAGVAGGTVAGPGAVAGAVTGADIEMYAAYGAANEVREVFRTLKATGIPADTAVVVYTSGRAYVSLFLSDAALVGIPVTFGEGVPVCLTRPGRVVLGLLRWVEGDCHANLLYHLLQGGDLDVEPTAHAAIALRKGFLSHIPAPDDHGLVGMKSLCSGLEHVVRGYSRLCDTLDAAAVDAVCSALAESAEAVLSDLLPLSEAVARIRAGIESLWAGASRPLPGHLHVTGLRGAGWDNRPHTFVVGLDATSFPGDTAQDPVLLDEERRLIDPGLSLRSAAATETIRRMAAFLASRRGKVFLSYSCYDVADCRPCFPSPLVLQVYRSISGNREAGYGDLDEALGDPRSYVPAAAHAVTGGEWWLRALRGAGDGGAVLDEVRKAYAGIDAGLLAEESRDGDALTVYDGVVGCSGPGSGAAADVEATEGAPPVVYSATALEDLAKCPFLYFVRHILGVEPPEDHEYDPGVWLDARSRGKLLHDIYRRCLEEALSAGTCAPLRDRVMEIASEACAAHREEVPPPGELVYEYEVEGIRRSLDVFLRVLEEMWREAVPVLLEKPFDPVEIPLPGGNRILVQGRIDRIDRIRMGDGHSYRVWDYKTGSHYEYEDRGYVRRGMQIQHAIYARAAVEILHGSGLDPGAMVVSSGYVFPTEKGEGRRVARHVRKWDRAQQAIDRITRVIRGGIFHATTDGERCGRCDYSPVCRGTLAAGRAKAKAEGGAAGFGPWKELQEYE